MTNYFVGQGSPLIEAHQQALACVWQQVQLQASFFAYMDAFWVLTLLALAAIPLALFASLTVLGTHDMMQTRHAVLRNYPISAHLRFLLEEMRP